VPGDCGLLARFIKAETLLVLTLWRIYHDARMEQAVEAVVVTANDIWQQLKLYFEQIELPLPRSFATCSARCAGGGARARSLARRSESIRRIADRDSADPCARHSV
jgi:hypothetical protein